MLDDVKKLSKGDFEQSNPGDFVKPIEEEELLDKRHLRWMRWALFGLIIIWCLISFSLFLTIILKDHNFYNLVSISYYSIFIIALLVVIPAFMLCYLTCSVFRVQGGINENAIVSIFTRLVRIWKAH